MAVIRPVTPRPVTVTVVSKLVSKCDNDVNTAVTITPVVTAMTRPATTYEVDTAGRTEEVKYVYVLREVATDMSTELLLFGVTLGTPPTPVVDGVLTVRPGPFSMYIDVIPVLVY